LLFDPRPKSSRSELFDRERELEELREAVEKRLPLVLLTGVRRIGKTSVLRVFLGELGAPHVLLDARSLPANYGLRDLYSVLAKGMSNRAFVERMGDVLRRVRGVRVLGFEVELSWGGREALSLPTLFDYLNERRVVVAVDEAQALRGPRGALFLEALAHAYDYDDNLTFILTGSEVGLLVEYIGVDDPRSPLYGRFVRVLPLERFSRDQSLEFMEMGLREAGLSLPPEALEAAVDFFDGIPGWLTLAGNYIVLRRGVVELDELKRAAVEVARGELLGVVRQRGERYARVLRLIAEGCNTWSKLKRGLEEVEGVTVSTSALSNILRTLEKLSIVKDYEFLDPVYREASKTLPARPTATRAPPDV